jgi:type II secretory pathway component PulC
MPASRRLRLALELGLVLLVVTLAAYGVSAAIRVATSGEAPVATFEPQDGGVARHALDPLIRSDPVIAARDVFNPAAATDRRVAEGLRLWGVGLHGTSGHAVIEDLETHRQELYRVGDAIRGARIVGIAWDRVTLEQSGQEATLELAPPGERHAAQAEGGATAPAQTRDHPPDRLRRFIVDRRELAGAGRQHDGS